MSIGEGIIGSAAEERDRKRVRWEAGSSYLLPCAKGIACGWIHRPNGPPGDSGTDDGGGGGGDGDGDDDALRGPSSTAGAAAADRVEGRRKRDRGAPPRADDAGAPTTTNDPAAEDVVIYSLKASPETLSGMEDKDLDEEGLSCWVEKSYKLFRRCLARSQRQTKTRSGSDALDVGKSEGVGTDAGMEGVPLSEEESAIMGLILELVK